jgi:hypothetical protein
MKKNKKLLILSYTFVIILTLLVMPIISFAAEVAPNNGLVTCDNVNTPCNFNSLMDTVNKVITFVLKDMVIPIAAIMFAYAGFLLVTSGGSTENRGKAKRIFTDAVIGLALAVAGWLIISTILAILGYDGTWIGLHVNLK